jgi:hypothetical protein
MWPEGLKKKFHEALIMLQEVRGEDETIHLLEEELERRRVVKEYRQNRREVLLAQEHAADLGRQLCIAVGALEFYGNGDHYEARSNRPSTIQKDKGLTARNALASIDDDSDDDEAEDE